MDSTFRSINWGKYLINTLFFLAFLYGLFIFRYFIYLLRPTEAFLQALLLNPYHIGFYYNPLLNKITFFIHIAGGALALCLAPFVFLGYKNEWASFQPLATWYMFFSVLIYLSFPLVALWQSHGTSVGLYLLILIEFLSIYLLARGYYFFKHQDFPTFMVYFIYLFSFQIGTGIFRPIETLFVAKFPISDTVMNYEKMVSHFEFTPNDMALDFGLLIALVIAVGIAKLLMWLQTINRY